MATVADAYKPIPWWKEPTREQWHAWVAAWLRIPVKVISHTG
ncbi:MAG: hypothetical protein WB710_14965 [Stellaceae bacterium]